MKKTLPLAAVVAASLWSAQANAFCGFYVAKADAKLFNKSSQVVIVHDGDRTVMTLSNDYQGDPQEFAMVIPVPVALEKEQVHVLTKKGVLARLDAYSSPRLVEYYDEDPCGTRNYNRMDALAGAGAKAAPEKEERSAQELAKALGVKIEATYTVGEYDIMILSAEQSNGLETWLRAEGYKIPAGASEVLASYLKANFHFFVAKVNLKEAAKTGASFLHPIQVAYESPKFMLPVRLGTVNADGPQDLVVYAITKTGRVESTNYLTARMPSDVNVPEYVKNDFGPFYKAVFDKQVKKGDTHAVFTEYAWDMSSCDPCAAEPLNPQEQRSLGVWWADDGDSVYLTRLHVRYDAAHFPEDIVFQTTPDQETFQARYVMQHPAPGWRKESCPAVSEYRRTLAKRHEDEAANLADLTGWDAAEIRTKMNLPAAPATPVTPSKPNRWWKRLWK
ncbi:MAG TPA: DUF2330 domain-containing protein [bacterium]|nr:DUF2330 domain-containing protein [bacterium]